MEVVRTTNIQGVCLIKPRLFQDERGSFFEPFNLARYQEHLGDVRFVQDNESYSRKGVLRGLHFQRGEFAQSKLVRVIKGKVLDVVLDLRASSPTFGQHESFVLDDVEKMQIFIPKGIAHGFLVLSDEAFFSYKVDAYYAPKHADGVHFADPELGIKWGMPAEELLVAQKDLGWPSFKDAYKFE